MEEKKWSVKVTLTIEKKEKREWFIKSNFICRGGTFHYSLITSHPSDENQAFDLHI